MRRRSPESLPLRARWAEAWRETVETWTPVITDDPALPLHVGFVCMWYWTVNLCSCDKVGLPALSSTLLSSRA